ncbi:MAG: L-2-hydroxyglutarate oxidase [Gammaproteobacteria bacterium]|jgi:L-2-hydroxyglutarate oxidase|tara:strand:- start:559 stop:1776 length:1218 start_codon:yes stop_codon:yes gene_type:complete
MMDEKIYDYIVVGGGIVGASTALSLITKHPKKQVLLVEKEKSFASHQTGHNSGVIHAGVYYEPGSLKAEFCREGLKETIKFCSLHQIPFHQCGKLIVATNDVELKRMDELYERCKSNDIGAEVLDQNKLNEIEPNVFGIGALLVKSTGIVNYKLITEKMTEQFESLGGEFLLNTKIINLQEDEDRIQVTTPNETFNSRYLVCCAGLMADRIAKLLKIKINFQIVPFRGEYFKLPEKHNNLVKHLIYPIPDPSLPFLGVHLTKMIDGSITVGPNAVLGFKREGYSKFNFSIKDTLQLLSFKGFHKVLTKNFKSGLYEMKNSIFKRGYLKEVQKYSPLIKLNDLQSYPAGIRAQAVLDDGTLVHDFLFAESKRSIHVCNAPSPAATSAIPIGRYITDKATEAYNKLT